MHSRRPTQQGETGFALLLPQGNAVSGLVLTMQDLLTNLSIAWTDPWLLFLTAAGTLAGIYVGAIPGLSVTMATSILISFTFKWPVNDALALIVGVFMGGVYGGSRTAILLNIPGAPSAIATAIEGYPMAKRGEAGEAIGLTTVRCVRGAGAASPTGYKGSQAEG